MNEANAIVVLFAGALGDFLLALPALRLLRLRHRGQRLVLAVRTPLVDLARRTGCADQVAGLDDPAVAVWLGGGAIPAWWPGRPRLYSWFGADDPSIRTCLEARAVAATFLRVERGEGLLHAGSAYARSIDEAPAWTELVALGALTPDTPVAACSPGRILVVHRGAGATAKRWRSEGFGEVVQWWCRRGGEVVDLLGPAEEALEPLPTARVVREAVLPIVLEIMAGAAAYLGNDSGPSHLAAALGMGGVVLFGPTDPARWRPLSARLEILRARPETWGPHGFSDPAARAVIRRLEGVLYLDTFWGGV